MELGYFVTENQELLKTAITVAGTVITTAIGAHVSIRLALRKRPRRWGKKGSR